jgi:hypothetical protein
MTAYILVSTAAELIQNRRQPTNSSAPASVCGWTGASTGQIELDAHRLWDLDDQPGD